MGVPSPPGALRRAARRELTARLGREQAAQITDRADAAHPEVAAHIPRTSAGARHLLRTGAYAITLQRELVERGWKQTEANLLISDAVFASIKRPRDILQRLGRLRHRNPLRAARWTSDLAQRLYYTPPGWEIEPVEVEGGFGLDITRCAIAEFFASLGMSELCQRAICDQDIRSAARHGLTLERSGTLSAGADRCDFRYYLSPSGT